MRPDASAPSLATLVQEFFCVRLIRQQDTRARTVASYRDTVRPLLGYLRRVRQKRPTDVAMAERFTTLLSAAVSVLQVLNPGGPEEPLKAQADALDWDIECAIKLLTT